MHVFQEAGAGTRGRSVGGDGFEDVFQFLGRSGELETVTQPRAPLSNRTRTVARSSLEISTSVRLVPVCAENASVDPAAL